MMNFFNDSVYMLSGAEDLRAHFVYYNLLITLHPQDIFLFLSFKIQYFFVVVWITVVESSCHRIFTVLLTSS